MSKTASFYTQLMCLQTGIKALHRVLRAHPKPDSSFNSVVGFSFPFKKRPSSTDPYELPFLSICDTAKAEEALRWWMSQLKPYPYREARLNFIVSYQHFLESFFSYKNWNWSAWSGQKVLQPLLKQSMLEVTHEVLQEITGILNQLQELNVNSVQTECIENFQKALKTPQIGLIKDALKSFAHAIETCSKTTEELSFELVKATLPNNNRTDIFTRIHASHRVNKLFVEALPYAVRLASRYQLSRWMMSYQLQHAPAPKDPEKLNLDLEGALRVAKRTQQAALESIQHYLGFEEPIIDWVQLILEKTENQLHWLKREFKDEAAHTLGWLALTEHVMDSVQSTKSDLEKAKKQPEKEVQLCLSSLYRIVGNEDSKPYLNLVQDAMNELNEASLYGPPEEAFAVDMLQQFEFWIEKSLSFLQHGKQTEAAKALHTLETLWVRLFSELHSLSQANVPTFKMGLFLNRFCLESKEHNNGFLASQLMQLAATWLDKKSIKLLLHSHSQHCSDFSALRWVYGQAVSLINDQDTKALDAQLSKLRKEKETWWNSPYFTNALAVQFRKHLWLLTKSKWLGLWTHLSPLETYANPLIQALIEYYYSPFSLEKMGLDRLVDDLVEKKLKSQTPQHYIMCLEGLLLEFKALNLPIPTHLETFESRFEDDKQWLIDCCEKIIFDPCLHLYFATFNQCLFQLGLKHHPLGVALLITQEPLLPKIVDVMVQGLIHAPNSDYKQDILKSYWLIIEACRVSDLALETLLNTFVHSLKQLSISQTQWAGFYKSLHPQSEVHMAFAYAVEEALVKEGTPVIDSFKKAPSLTFELIYTLNDIFTSSQEDPFKVDSQQRLTWNDSFREHLVQSLIQKWPQWSKLVQSDLFRQLDVLFQTLSRADIRNSLGRVNTLRLSWANEKELWPETLYFGIELLLTLVESLMDPDLEHMFKPGRDEDTLVRIEESIARFVAQLTSQTTLQTDFVATLLKRFLTRSKQHSLTWILVHASNATQKWTILATFSLLAKEPLPSDILTSIIEQTVQAVLALQDEDFNTLTTDAEQAKKLALRNLVKLGNSYLKHEMRSTRLKSSIVKLWERLFERGEWHYRYFAEFKPLQNYESLYDAYKRFNTLKQYLKESSPFLQTLRTRDFDVLRDFLFNSSYLLNPLKSHGAYSKALYWMFLAQSIYQKKQRLSASEKQLQEAIQQQLVSFAPEGLLSLPQAIDSIKWCAQGPANHEAASLFAAYFVSLEPVHQVSYLELFRHQPQQLNQLLTSPIAQEEGRSAFLANSQKAAQLKPLLQWLCEPTQKNKLFIDTVYKLINHLNNHLQLELLNLKEIAKHIKHSALDYRRYNSALIRFNKGLIELKAEWLERGLATASQLDALPTHGSDLDLLEGALKVIHSIHSHSQFESTSIKQSIAYLFNELSLVWVQIYLWGPSQQLLESPAWLRFNRQELSFVWVSKAFDFLQSRRLIALKNADAISASGLFQQESVSPLWAYIGFACTQDISFEQLMSWIPNHDDQMRIINSILHDYPLTGIRLFKAALPSVIESLQHPRLWKQWGLLNQWGNTFKEKGQLDESSWAILRLIFDSLDETTAQRFDYLLRTQFGFLIQAHPLSSPSIPDFNVQQTSHLALWWHQHAEHASFETLVHFSQQILSQLSLSKALVSDMIYSNAQIWRTVLQDESVMHAFLTHLTEAPYTLDELKNCLELCQCNGNWIAFLNETPDLVLAEPQQLLWLLLEPSRTKQLETNIPIASFIRAVLNYDLFQTFKALWVHPNPQVESCILDSLVSNGDSLLEKDYTLQFLNELTVYPDIWLDLLMRLITKNHKHTATMLVSVLGHPLFLTFCNQRSQLLRQLLERLDGIRDLEGEIEHAFGLLLQRNETVNFDSEDTPLNELSILIRHYLLSKGHALTPAELLKALASMDQLPLHFQSSQSETLSAIFADESLYEGLYVIFEANPEWFRQWLDPSFVKALFSAVQSGQLTASSHLGGFILDQIQKFHHEELWQFIRMYLSEETLPNHEAFVPLLSEWIQGEVTFDESLWEKCLLCVNTPYVHIQNDDAFLKLALTRFETLVKPLPVAQRPESNAPVLSIEQRLIEDPQFIKESSFEPVLKGKSASVSKQLWEKMVQLGYIDESGQLTDSFLLLNIEDWIQFLDTFKLTPKQKSNITKILHQKLDQDHFLLRIFEQFDKQPKLRKGWLHHVVYRQLSWDSPSIVSLVQGWEHRASILDRLLGMGLDTEEEMLIDSLLEGLANRYIPTLSEASTVTLPKAQSVLLFLEFCHSYGTQDSVQKLTEPVFSYISKVPFYQIPNFFTRIRDTNLLNQPTKLKFFHLFLNFENKNFANEILATLFKTPLFLELWQTVLQSFNSDELERTLVKSGKCDPLLVETLTQNIIEGSVQSLEWFDKAPSVVIEYLSGVLERAFEAAFSRTQTSVAFNDSALYSHLALLTRQAISKQKFGFVEALVSFLNQSLRTRTLPLQWLYAECVRIGHISLETVKQHAQQLEVHLPPDALEQWHSYLHQAGILDANQYLMIQSLPEQGWASLPNELKLTFREGEKLMSHLLEERLTQKDQMLWILLKHGPALLNEGYVSRKQTVHQLPSSQVYVLPYLINHQETPGVHYLMDDFIYRISGTDEGERWVWDFLNQLSLPKLLSVLLNWNRSPELREKWIASLFKGDIKRKLSFISTLVRQCIQRVEQDIWNSKEEKWALKDTLLSLYIASPAVINPLLSPHSSLLLTHLEFDLTRLNEGRARVYGLVNPAPDLLKLLDQGFSALEVLVIAKTYESERPGVLNACFSDLKRYWLKPHDAIKHMGGFGQMASGFLRSLKLGYRCGKLGLDDLILFDSPSKLYIYLQQVGFIDSHNQFVIANDSLQEAVDLIDCVLFLHGYPKHIPATLEDDVKKLQSKLIEVINRCGQLKNFSESDAAILLRRLVSQGELKGHYWHDFLQDMSQFFYLLKQGLVRELWNPKWRYMIHALFAQDNGFIDTTELQGGQLDYFLEAWVDILVPERRSTLEDIQFCFISQNMAYLISHGQSPHWEQIVAHYFKQLDVTHWGVLEHWLSEYTQEENDVKALLIKKLGQLGFTLNGFTYKVLQEVASAILAKLDLQQKRLESVFDAWEQSNAETLPNILRLLDDTLQTDVF